MMTIDDNKATTRRFHEELNKRNFAILDELIADDYVEHNPLLPATLGKQETIGLFHAIYTALPDMHRTVEGQIAEGDLVVDRITYTGTQNGDFMGIPATGKHATVSAILIFRIANGKIVENWSVIDMFGMMQQLGVVPPLGGGAG